MTVPEIQDGAAPPVQNTPESVLVHEIPETPEAKVEIQETGVTSIPSQFTTVIQDDAGKPMTVSPATQTITITLPATQTQLLDWAKGPDENALTWLAKFWLRMMKKALQLGWNVVSGNNGSTASANR